MSLRFILKVSAVAMLAAPLVMPPTAGRAQTATDSKLDAPPRSQTVKSETDRPAPEPGAIPSAEPAEPAIGKPTRDNPWVTLAPLPQPASDLAGVAVNGKLYLFGGLDNNRPTGLVFEYDAARDAWTRKKPMPVATHRFAVAAYGDKIYLFGGFKYPDSGAIAWQPVDNAWRYDPSSDEWTALAVLPDKRGAAAAAAVDGRIFVIGGATMQPGTRDIAIQPKRRHAIVGAVDEYDPKTNAWRARTKLPTPRSHAAVAVVGGKIYIAGGRIGSAFADDGSDTDVVEAYDPARNLWSRPLERMRTPRGAMGAANWRNRVVIVGGEQARSGSVPASAAVEAYDPETDRWRSLGQLADPRRGIATGLIGDRLYVAGGAAAPSPASPPEESAKKPPQAPGGRTAVQALQLDLFD